MRARAIMPTVKTDCGPLKKRCIPEALSGALRPSVISRAALVVARDKRRDRPAPVVRPAGRGPIGPGFSGRRVSDPGCCERCQQPWPTVTG